MKIALMGASGFIGSRMVEMFHLGRLGDVRPIVRSYGSLARLARFDLDWRLANAADENALKKAFEGCDLVVHCVHGHPDIVEGSIAPTYRAARRVGVKRMVYLSTASVHGQSPSAGTDETSPLSDRQATDYNNRKVRAERLLLRERKRGSTEVVILRPGIVFGPRDRWITGIANDLVREKAFLVEGGKGICNSIYVDNLVYAIKLALSAVGADGEAFLVGDRETVTWANITYQVADAFGISRDEIKTLAAPEFRSSFADNVNHFRGHWATQSVLPIIPARLKRIAKASLAAWPNTQAISLWSLPALPQPHVSREMSELHRCQVKLPFDKAKQILGYEPVVSFQDGLFRTIQWLEQLNGIH
jgi:nucleoside-diphosphate-sugar epimerase